MAGFLVEVEQALGPGVDFERDGHGQLLGRRARSGRLWFGFDRAALVDSDDGLGRRVAVLVAVPASTFAGCRLEIELTGAWQTRSGSVLVGRVAGTPLPPPPLARIAASVDEGTWLDIEAAERVARHARQRFRERQSHARISGGRAWHAIGTLPPDLARFATPHSAAEYSLARLPPRFVRGLEDLLDGDERILYWVERPMAGDPGVVERLRRRVDRRAALLLLTDRQLLWIVDHAQPDRYLSDWGVDVELVPVERVLDVRYAESGEIAELLLTTGAGARAFSLPVELSDEIRVMRDLVARFRPAAAGRLPRRRYALEPLGFDSEAAARFGQEPEARAMFESAGAEGEVLAFLFSPRRPGQAQPAAIALFEDRVVALGRDHRAVELSRLASLQETLSPLVGRISLGRDIRLTYPGPLIDRGARFVRQTRRALAMVG
jgi:hypothetical protein